MRRNFYLYKRKEIYYARIVNPITKRTLTARSTGKTSRDEAAAIAMKWVETGLPPVGHRESKPLYDLFTFDELLFRLRNTEFSEDDVKKIIETLKKRGYISSARLSEDNEKSLIDFLTEFWDFDKSPYVKEKLSHGQKIGRSYVLDQLGKVKRYWDPYFNKKLLSEVTRQDLQKFSIHVSELKKVSQKGKVLDSKLSPQTINHILKAGTVALKWAADNDVIDNDPGKGLMKFAGQAKRRGILSDKELKKLFTEGEWKGNPGNKLACILAAQTGMRLGEVTGLTVQDIIDDRILVRRSWSDKEGLKSTKTGESREIPILKALRADLMAHANINPHGVGPDTFVFWNSDIPDRPQGSRAISEMLNNVMSSIGIDSEQRKARGLCFHGLRHLYSKKMADALNERAMKLTGHKSDRVFEEYSNHRDEKDFKHFSEVTEQVFGKIIPFTPDIDKKAE